MCNAEHRGPASLSSRTSGLLSETDDLCPPVVAFYYTICKSCGTLTFTPFSLSQTGNAGVSSSSVYRNSGKSNFNLCRQTSWCPGLYVKNGRMNCWYRNGVKCAMLTGHCQRLSEKKLLRFPYSLLATRVTASRTQALKPSCPELQLTLLESLPKTDRLKALAGFPWFKPG